MKRDVETLRKSNPLTALMDFDLPEIKKLKRERDEAREEATRIRGLLYAAKQRLESIRDEIHDHRNDCDIVRSMSMSASDGVVELGLDGDIIPEESGSEATEFHLKECPTCGGAGLIDEERCVDPKHLYELQDDALSLADTCRIALNQWRELWEREEEDDMFTDNCAEAVQFRQCHAEVTDFYSQYASSANTQK